MPSVREQDTLRTLDQLRDEILNNYYKRHSKPNVGSMCDDDLNLLRNWQWNRNITDAYADFLTVEGWNELKFLAIRLQRAFPKLLEKDYDRQKFHFMYTATQRAEASFKGFVEGLFGEGAHDNIVVPQPTINDTILRVSAAHPFNRPANSPSADRFSSASLLRTALSDVQPVPNLQGDGQRNGIS